MVATVMAPGQGYTLSSDGTKNAENRPRGLLRETRLKSGPCPMGGWSQGRFAAEILGQDLF